MKKIAIAVLLSAVVATPAIAADMGAYAGLRVGQAKTSVDNTTLSTDNPTGWGVFAGYTFNPNFAAEAEYLELGEIKASGVGGGSAKSNGFSISGVGSYPINDQFSLFAKLGYAMITSKMSGGGGDAKSNAVTYGVGAQYNVSPVIGVRLGWDKYKFDDSGKSFKGNANLVSIGGVFKF